MMKKVVGFAVIASMLATGTSFAKDNGKQMQQENWGKTSGNVTAHVTFDDENGAGWATKFIEYVGQKGYMHGDKGSKHFRPNGQLSREEFAAVFNNKFHVQASTSPISFADVAQNRWSYQAIEALTTGHYMDFYKSSQNIFSFHPTQAVTREDVAETLVKAYNLTVMDPQSAQQLLQQRYKDASQVAPNLVPYVATAVEHNIMLGSGSKFRPLDPLSRAETAALLYKLDNTQIVTGTPTDGQITVTGDTYGSTPTTGTVSTDTYDAANASSNSSQTGSVDTTPAPSATN